MADQMGICMHGSGVILAVMQPGLHFVQTVPDRVRLDRNVSVGQNCNNGHLDTVNFALLHALTLLIWAS